MLKRISSPSCSSPVIVSEALTPVHEVNLAEDQDSSTGNSSDMETDESLDMDTDDSEEEESDAGEDPWNETILVAYLSEQQKEFVPYEIDEETNQLLQVCEKDMLDSEEITTWYCSSRHKAIKTCNKNGAATLEKIAPFSNKQFWIESSVVGGRCYRLLLGKNQPKMHACQDIPNNKVYRLSREVIDYQPMITLIDKLSQMASQKPVTGLTALVLFSYFLGDNDLNRENFGLIELDDSWQAVEIDPECCFSSFFYENDVSTILNFIEELSLKVPGQLYNHNELLHALLTIINTPLSAFSDILDKSFSKKYELQKALYLKTLTNRVKAFEEAAHSIKVFEDFFHCKTVEDNAQDMINQPLLIQSSEVSPQNQIPVSMNRFGFYSQEPSPNQSAPQETFLSLAT